MNHDEKYNISYIEMKKWSIFCPEISSNENRYFERELARLGLKSPKKILEVGFGAGHFLRFCKNSKIEVVGVEINSILIRDAVLSDYNAIHSDDLDGLFDNDFDAIFLFDVIEHLEFVQLVDMFRILSKKLKPDGVIVARCPNGDSSLGLVNQNGDYTHVTSFGVGKIRQLAVASGLSFIRLSKPACKFKILSASYFFFKVREFVFWLLEKLFKISFGLDFQVILFSPNIISIFKKEMSL